MESLRTGDNMIWIDLVHGIYNYRMYRLIVLPYTILYLVHIELYRNGSVSFL